MARSESGIYCTVPPRVFVLGLCLVSVRFMLYRKQKAGIKLMRCIFMLWSWCGGGIGKVMYWLSVDVV